MKHHLGLGKDHPVTASLIAALPVAVGLWPIGLAFGLFVVRSGFSWWWTPIFSCLIYAGSCEFVAVGLATAGAGAVVGAMTALAVNFRHVFYGLTYPLTTIRGVIKRFFGIYLLTDEVYALSAADRIRPTSSAMMAVSVFCWLNWVIPGMMGAAIGHWLPASIRGMEFALTALMIVLAREAFDATRDASLPLSAGVIAIAWWLIAPHAALLGGLVTYCALIIVRWRWPAVDSALRMTLPKRGTHR